MFKLSFVLAVVLLMAIETRAVPALQKTYTQTEASKQETVNISLFEGEGCKLNFIQIRISNSYNIDAVCPSSALLCRVLTLTSHHPYRSVVHEPQLPTNLL